MTENDVRQIVMEMVGRFDNALANNVIAHIDGGRQEQAGHQGVNARVSDPPVGDFGIDVGGGGAGLPGTFEMSVSGTTATFTNCTVQRQMYFIAAADKTCTVTLTGDCYIGYVLTEADNSIAMATGAAFTDVADTAAPADQSTFKVPLYKLTNGAVVCDYRKMTRPGAWA